MAKWNPYSLKKPCANCPFLKDKSKAIDLHPERVPGIVKDLLTGEATSFSCHKTVHNRKTGGTWTEDEDGNEVYEQSGNEKQCAGSLIMMQKLGVENQLMQVMRRMHVYNPEDFKPFHDLIIEPEDIGIEKPKKNSV
jgi:hypothetical protein